MCETFGVPAGDFVLSTPRELCEAFGLPLSQLPTDRCTSPTLEQQGPRWSAMASLFRELSKSVAEILYPANPHALLTSQACASSLSSGSGVELSQKEVERLLEGLKAGSALKRGCAARKACRAILAYGLTVQHLEDMCSIQGSARTSAVNDYTLLETGQHFLMLQ
jgi:hypothetical protein